MQQYRDAMSRALFLANRAASAGDVPVGAVVLDPTGKIIGEGWNVREAHHDPSGHAEIMALRQAGEKLRRWNLVGCTLVVTLEPCTMCAGAAVSARVDRVVFGAWEPKTGAAGSLRDVLRDSRMGQNIEVIPGVLASEASAQLTAFFDECRQREALKDRIPPAAGSIPGKPLSVTSPSRTSPVLVEAAFSEFAEMAAAVKIPVLENLEWDEDAKAKFGALPRVPALGERPRYQSLSDEELRELDEQRREREALEGTRFTLPRTPHEDAVSVPASSTAIHSATVRPSALPPSIATHPSTAVPQGVPEPTADVDPLLEQRLAALPEDVRSLIAGIAVRRRR